MQQLVFSPGGYGWIATDEGVRRYDGYAAVPLAQLVRQGVAAPTGYLQLVLDSAGTLWLGADTGLFHFVPGTGQLTRLALPAAAGEPRQVTALWYDARTRRLWVGYGQHLLAVLGPAHPQRLTSLPPACTGHDQVLRIAPGSGRTMWLTTSQHLLMLDGRARPVRQLARPTEAVVPVPGTWPQLLVGSTALFELDTIRDQLRERQRWLPDPQHYDVRFEPQLDSLARPCAWLAGGQRLRLRWRPGRALPQVQRAPMGINPADAGSTPRADRLYQLQRDRCVSRPVKR